MISDEKVYTGVRQNILKLREKHPQTERKVTQAELAKKIGIKRATLTNIELGNQRAPIHVIYRVCDFFGVSLEEVMPPISEVKESEIMDVNEVKVGGESHSVPAQLAGLVKKARSN